MMRFCSLGSGSSGNATIVEGSEGITTTRVLVDCGFTQRELAARLARASLALDDIDAIFVTHEHGDHVGCSVALAKRHRIPVWMSRGTWRAVGQPELPAGLLHFARDGEDIVVGDLQIAPYTVPHDAQEPLQPCFSDGAFRLGVLTDAGSATTHLLAQLQGCHALLLECNHDVQMLEQGPYPWPLKRRVGGPRGHLANEQAAAILRACRHDGLRHVVAAHLSRQNNRPELAAATIAAVLATRPDDIVVADAFGGTPWLGLR